MPGLKEYSPFVPDRELNAPPFKRLMLGNTSDVVPGNKNRVGTNDIAPGKANSGLVNGERQPLTLGQRCNSHDRHLQPCEAHYRDQNPQLWRVNAYANDHSITDIEYEQTAENQRH